MSNSCTLHLPVGIQQSDGTWTKEVEIEEMTGEEEDILADAAKAPGGRGVLAKSSSRRVTEVLSRCTKRIGTETRPDGKDRFNLPLFFENAWFKAFTNDRGFAVIRLRQLSLGDIYTFGDECPECRKELKRITIDLSALEVKSVPLDVVSSSSGVFTTKLPSSGKVVAWKILRGEDEPKFDEIREGRRSDLMSALLFMRLVTIDGDKPKFEDLRRLSSKDRMYLRVRFDELEGGIDTEAVIRCDNPVCGAEFKRHINPGSQSFFFPSEIQ